MHLLILLTALLSCTADTDSEDTDAPPDIVDCGQDLRGSLAVQESHDYWGAEGHLYDAAQPMGGTVVLQEGDCVYAEARVNACDPPCESPLVCGRDDQCQPMPERFSAGTLTVAGPERSVDFEPTEWDYYYGDVGSDLYEPGQSVTFTLQGSEELEGFSASVPGVAKLGQFDISPVLERGKDMHYTWQPASAPESGLFILHMDIDHHAWTPAWVECVALDSAGELVVPSALGDALLTAGDSGIGTYVENSTVTRLSQACVQTSRGVVQVRTSSGAWIAVQSVP